MENWQLKYLGEQLLKLPTQKYQIALTGLFLYDEGLIAYQPKIEHTVTVGVGKKRIDLYYESCKLAIEIDEPFHKRNLEDDKKREQEISKEIPGIHFERIDIVEENWFEKYLEIKKKILENKIIMPWLESDVVLGFKKLNEIKTKEIGDQIKFISLRVRMCLVIPSMRKGYYNRSSRRFLEGFWRNLLMSWYWSICPFEPFERNELDKSIGHRIILF